MTQRIHISSPLWQMTFPHRIVPYQDEWLPGLLLRCDKVNFWESGTAVAHAFRFTSMKTFKNSFGWIVTPPLMLDSLAQMLAVTKRNLLTTTYYTELANLYGTVSPHSTQLGRSFSFRLCPACVAESYLLMRVCVLPHLRFCPIHGVAFVEKCKCNTVLQLFSRQTLPFSCYECGLDWSQLPQLCAVPEHLELEKKVLAYYNFFFAKGTPELLAFALQLIREKLKREKEVRVKLLDGRIKHVEHYELRKASLSYLIDLLMGLDLSPHDLVISYTSY